MHTVDLDGANIHLGACYLHNPTPHHRILKIMEELGIKSLNNNYDREAFIGEDGEEVSRKKVMAGQ